MKTISIQVFEYSELTEKAQAKASQNYEPVATDFYNETMQAIQKVFPINNISIDNDFRISATVHEQETEDQKTFEQYQKDFKYPTDIQCGLTWTYSDYEFLNALPKENPITREDLIYALQKLASTYRKEYHSEFEDENLSDYYTLNDIYFLADGSFAP